MISDGDLAAQAQSTADEALKLVYKLRDAINDQQRQIKDLEFRIFDLERDAAQ